MFHHLLHLSEYLSKGQVVLPKLLHNGYGYAKIDDSRPSKSDSGLRFISFTKFVVAWLGYDAGNLK